MALLCEEPSQSMTILGKTSERYIEDSNDDSREASPILRGEEDQNAQLQNSNGQAHNLSAQNKDQSRLTSQFGKLLQPISPGLNLAKASINASTLERPAKRAKTSNLSFESIVRSQRRISLGELNHVNGSQDIFSFSDFEVSRSNISAPFATKSSSELCNSTGDLDVMNEAHIRLSNPTLGRIHGVRTKIVDTACEEHVYSQHLDHGLDPVRAHDHGAPEITAIDSVILSTNDELLDSDTGAHTILDTPLMSLQPSTHNLVDLQIPSPVDLYTPTSATTSSGVRSSRGSRRSGCSATDMASDTIPGIISTIPPAHISSGDSGIDELAEVFAPVKLKQRIVAEKPRVADVPDSDSLVRRAKPMSSQRLKKRSKRVKTTAFAELLPPDDDDDDEEDEDFATGFRIPVTNLDIPSFKGETNRTSQTRTKEARPSSRKTRGRVEKTGDKINKPRPKDLDLSCDDSEVMVPTCGLSTERRVHSQGRTLVMDSSDEDTDLIPLDQPHGSDEVKHHPPRTSREETLQDAVCNQLEIADAAVEKQVTVAPKTDASDLTIPDSVAVNASPDARPRHSPIKESKIAFRVGLSKRAKIQPLLMIVRK